LKFFAQVTAWVAFPVVIALFIGRWLDRQFNTEPWIFLGLTFFAFLVSIIAIINYANIYLKNIEAENKLNKKNDSNIKSEK